MLSSSKSILLLCFLSLFFSDCVFAQSRKVIFFKGYHPFHEDMYNHQVKIVDGDEVQYARPNTVYKDSYGIIGKLKPCAAIAYSYIMPIPSFYIGYHKRELYQPADSIQFVRVYTRRSFLSRAHFKYKPYTQQQFQELYMRKKWLRKVLAKQGYHSVEELVKG